MTVENEIVLKADEGKTLTNGETYGKRVRLGKHDSVDNWYEITTEEYEKILEENNSSVTE